jgi:hypothetical protein
MSWRKYGAVRYGFLLATVITASNQTLSVDSASIALSAPTAQITTPGTPHYVPFQRPVFQRGIRWIGPTGYSATPGGGATQTLTASAQTLALSAPAATVSVGGVGLSAGANTVSLSAPAATLSVSGTPHHVPFGRPVFQRGLRWFGPIGYTTTPETANPTLSAGTQTIALSAPAAVRVAGTVALSAGSQTLALSAPAAALAAGGSALSAGAQSITLSAPAATLGSQALSVPIVFGRPVFQRAIRFYGPPSLSVTPDVNRTLDASAQTLALSAPTATLTTPGVSASAALVKFRFVKGSAAPRPARVIAHGAIDDIFTAQTLTVDAAVLALSAPTATLATTAAAETPLALRKVRLVKGRALNLPRLATSYGFVARSAFPQTVAATQNTITLSAPTATLLQAGVLLAGTQTIALSAPAATATVGAVTRSAGAQTLALRAPTATIGQSVNVAANTIALSNGQATLTAGAATVQAGRQTLALSAPGANVLGATTLPDIVVSTLESRMPERTLGARTPKRTLDRRNGDRTLEFNG